MKGGHLSDRIFQCCGSGMFIPDPNFLSIPNPTTATKEEEKKLPYVLIPFFARI
jgi:hypothetical protein